MTLKKTLEQFAAESELIKNGEYSLTPNSVYEGNKIRMTLFHHACGEEIKVIPRNFLKGKGCSNCTKKEKIENYRIKKRDEYVEFIKTNTNNEYSLLVSDNYVGSHTPCEMIHHICGHVFSPNPYDFKAGSRCPKCRKIGKAKNPAIFKEEVKRLGNGEYIFPDGEEYKNSKQKVTLIHTICGQSISVLPTKFILGKRCSCNTQDKAKEQLALEKMKERIRILGNGDYELVEENYKKTNEKVSIFHKSCGRMNNTRLDNFLSGSRCRHCFEDSKKGRKRRLKTTEFFSKEVEEKGNGEYELVEGAIYQNSVKKIQMRHILCQHEYSVTPGNFLKGRRCPKCAKAKPSKQKKTHEQFTHEVFQQVNDEYSVLNKYNSTHQKVKMKHNKCNFEWDITPSSFLQGTRCPNCAALSGQKKRTLPLKSLLLEIKEKYGDEYIYKKGQPFVNRKTDVLIIHSKCGYEYAVKPYNLLNGRGCPKCSRRKASTKRRKSLLELKEQVHSLTGDEYSIPNNQIYKNTDTHLSFLHNTCGHTWDVTPASFLNGTRCPNCNGGVSMTHEEFLKKFDSIAKQEYKLIPHEKYQSYNKHLMIQHSCGNSYSVTPANFFSGTRCQYCANGSKGENVISDFLVDNNIRFIPQKSFADCVYKRRLRFDFAIYSKRNLVALIEFNGLQHYEAIEYFGGEENLKENQLRDNIKKDYCKDKNIPLIIIKYDENIQERLANELTHLIVGNSSKIPVFS